MQAAAWDAKSEGAFVRMREQTIASSVVMQPTYSDLVKFVDNYCRNTQNICATNETCEGSHRLGVAQTVFGIRENSEQLISGD